MAGVGDKPSQKRDSALLFTARGAIAEGLAASLVDRSAGSETLASGEVEKLLVKMEVSVHGLRKAVEAELVKRGHPELLAQA